MPQINTRTFAGVVIAALVLAACSGASTTEPRTSSGAITTTLSVDGGQKAADIADSFARGVQAAASADGIEITDDETACMAKAILTGVSAARLVALAAQGGDIDSLDSTDRSAMIAAVTTCVPADRIPETGSGASSDTNAFANAQLLARSFTESFEAQGGLTITPDQADCMANSILDAFDPDELQQIGLDTMAGKPDNPEVFDRGADAILKCLPADAAAALGTRDA